MSTGIPSTIQSIVLLPFWRTARWHPERSEIKLIWDDYCCGHYDI